MGLGEIWFDSDGLLVAVNGLIQLPQGSEHIAKVVMGLRVIGLDGYGFVEAGHGVLKTALFLQKEAHAVVGFTQIRA